MNQTVEKWLMIGATTGWVASIGSLIGLAVRAASPTIASRPAQTALFSASRSAVQVQPPVNPVEEQREIAASSIPIDTSKGYWVESLKARSTPGVHSRSR